jgi:hypothetical protein
MDNHCLQWKMAPCDYDISFAEEEAHHRWRSWTAGPEVRGAGTAALRGHGGRAGTAILRSCGLGLDRGGVGGKQGAALHSVARLHLDSIHLSFCTGCTQHVKTPSITCDIPLQTLMFVEALSYTRAGYGRIKSQLYIRHSCGEL